MEERGRSGDTSRRDRLAHDRTVLANERTLLAYIRTALAFLVTGLGALRFFDGPVFHVLAWVSFAASASLLVVGLVRYAAVRRSLEEPPSPPTSPS